MGEAAAHRDYNRCIGFIAAIATRIHTLSDTARMIGLIVAIAMLFFSGYIYVTTADWVALVFILGSLGYIALFWSTSTKGNP